MMDKISIHAPRTGSDENGLLRNYHLRISIHAPRTGSDLIKSLLLKCSSNFNPRSPHGERHHVPVILPLGEGVFQSTLPARGATEILCISKESARFQSTLPARGATERRGLKMADIANFNPRSPHGERRRSISCSKSLTVFQSTLPARGATRWEQRGAGRRSISIHAPRTGSDGVHRRVWRDVAISIHAPRTGSDDTVPPFRRFISIFQSTLPARGATIPYADAQRDMTISIHAPRTGSDTYKCPDCGATIISIHAPRTGSDQAVDASSNVGLISIHAPRTGSDRAK